MDAVITIRTFIRVCSLHIVASFSIKSIIIFCVNAHDFFMNSTTLVKYTVSYIKERTKITSSNLSGFVLLKKNSTVCRWMLTKICFATTTSHHFTFFLMITIFVEVFHITWRKKTKLSFYWRSLNVVVRFSSKWKPLFQYLHIVARCLMCLRWQL